MMDLAHQVLTLPEDVVLVPVAQLPEPLREHFGDSSDEYALTRPRARATTKLVAPDAARLLERFRQPQTIVTAVIAHSRASGEDPDALLEAAFPLLQELVSAGLLLPEDALAARPITSTLRVGDWLGDWRVLRTVNLLDDSELHQARDADGRIAALKVARAECRGPMRERLIAEARILAHLEGRAAPALLELGLDHDTPYLASAWLPGIDAGRAAYELRHAGASGELLRLLARIATAYAKLHAAGVLHGDVHPGNVLVDREGAVSLIDFGLACFADQASHAARGGIAFYHAPEYAAALLQGAAPPVLSASEEQYSLAAMLYQLAAGGYCLDFDLRADVMLRQIVDEPPAPFENGETAAWPELEAVLGRALAKCPADRFVDSAAFAEALSCLADPPPAPARAATASALAALEERLLADLSLDGAWFREGLPISPRCSVEFGAAGIAYSLYRLAITQERPALLALADAWITKAERDRSDSAAFANPALDATPGTLGPISPYHTASGLALVRALVSRAAGQLGELAEAVADFIARSDVGAAGAERDLVLGRTGTVLACCLLLDALPAELDGERQALVALGSERLAAIWREISGFAAIADCTDWPNLGIAHGWAGFLYTTLRWQQVSGIAPPPQLPKRLEQLASLARPEGRGLTWPWRDTVDAADRSMPGWCNGSAGMVHLGCLASRTLGDPSLLELAIGAGWNALEAALGVLDLCCGLAGRGYALLALHRATGEPRWLERARALAEAGAAAAEALESDQHPPYALYKGALGLILLASDLERPDMAAMPVFGDEGWRSAEQA